MKVIPLFMSTALILTASYAQTVLAAELRPLVLPSTQQLHIQRQGLVEPSGTSMYVTFAEKVKMMGSEEKDAYRERYTRELDEAVRNRDYERTGHFNRLLEILSRY
jgi:hypothetical protein